MKAMKRILIVLAVALAAIFFAGRYGWKVGGFRACQGAGISSLEVGEDAVHITGFYPGSFPQGFCGYYSEERDGTLYVGFRFSGLFGFFETGDFDITIPIQGRIDQVILKTERVETTVWRRSTGSVLEPEDVDIFYEDQDPVASEEFAPVSINSELHRFRPEAVCIRQPLPGL